MAYKMLVTSKTHTDGLPAYIVLFSIVIIKNIQTASKSVRRREKKRKLFKSGQPSSQSKNFRISVRPFTYVFRTSRSVAHFAGFIFQYKWTSWNKLLRLPRVILWTAPLLTLLYFLILLSTADIFWSLIEILCITCKTYIFLITLFWLRYFRSICHHLFMCSYTAKTIDFLTLIHFVS